QLLKTPIPLQNFELVYGFKSNKTTYQKPLTFWYEGEESAPMNPLLLETLLYERLKEEVFQVKAHKKSILPFNLKLKGRLLMNQNGFFKLKIIDDFIESFQKNIRTIGAERPPHLTISSPLGYHLGVIMPSEYQSKKLWGKVREVGREFYFVVQGCYQ